MTDETRQEGFVPWWGDYELLSGQTGRWVVGPLSLWVSNRNCEWRLGYQREADATLQALEVECPVVGEVVVPEGVERSRLATRQTGSVVRLEPGLADRGVVSRPEIPFQLLPDDDVELFVSTPLWIRVLAGEDRDRVLLDVPLSRPSDTWIGPDTTRGSLAYAARTAMRLDPENVPVYPGRAVTCIRLVNRARDPLVLERLNLPVTGLSIFVGPEGRLWTEPVTLDREPDGVLAAVRIEPGEPPGVEGAELVAAPRWPARRGGFIQALSSLLG